MQPILVPFIFLSLSFLSGRYPAHMVPHHHTLPPTGIPHPAIVTPPIKQEPSSVSNGTEAQ